MHTMKIGKISIVNGMLIAILIINCNYAQTTPPGFGIYHPCVNHSVIISNSNRTINYTLQNGEHDDCESSYITAGWYRYEMLQNIPTKPPLAGQCGSSSPIWLNGTYPVIPYKNHSMLACKVGSSSNCEDSWNIIVQNCLTFNVIYLEPFPSCGRYCMEPEWNYPSWIDACFYNNTIVTGDYTRTLDYVLSEGMSEDCESSNLTAGWYRYDGFQNIPTTPPSPGQCGSSSPIWLNGTYPDMPGMITPMTACAVSYSSSCQESWPVKALNCYSYNVVYLQPNGNCSKYCMNSQTYQIPTGSENCYTAAVIESTDDRTVEYDLMMNEIEKCDNITEGWYRFQENQNILNYPPSIGQCSSRAPIWLEGKYPTTYGETKTMKACMVSNNTNCENKGNVTVMNCYSYNVAYLTSLNGCGRICMEQQNSSGTTPPTMNHPCYSTSVIEGTYDRTFNYILLPGEVEDCDNITEGWYTFASGQSVPTTSPVPGQCGSRSPIWFSGTYPTSFEETTTMKACMVSNFSNCEDSWNVTVMHCYGYNVAFMKEVNDCGRVCMEQMNSSGTTPPTMNHPCYSTSVIEGTYDRTFNYILQPGEVEDCDNITEGWYTFASGQSVPTTSPVPGQCGSRSPIWFSGTYPTSFEETTTMKACMVSNFSNCEDSWNVTVMHCYGYNVAYMKEVNDCGRVCMEQMNSSGTTPPTMNHPCYSTSVIEGTYDRTFNYILQPGEVEDCDNITEGWYTFASGQSVPTTSPVPGQCGSRSPIWFSGTYPTSFEETTTMKACMVSNFSNCEDNWNVTVMHCYGYNVAYMKEVNDCGRVCMEQMNSSGTTPPTMNHPCYSTSVIEGTYDRTFNYILQPGEVEDCDNITEGWYTFASGQSVPTTSPVPGQCGSRSPIWFSGTYPTSFEETTTMKACMVSNFSNCEDSWNVTVMHCYGYNVAYMKEVNDCGRVCMEQMNSSGTTPPTMNHPCYSTSVIEGTYDRTFNYILQPGEVEDCDNITEGWYTFASQQNVPTTPPVPGQCGSRSPVWFSGIYPTSFEETTTIKACMVSNFTNCEDSWNVTVMHCYGYNVAYMKKLNDCGRVCMESNEAFNETTNQHSSTVHPSQSFIHNASVSQENLEASYTSPYSSFQPHATTVMSDTFSGEPAPYSGYLPSETNHFYETTSYDKTYSDYQSFDQLSSTVSSRNIQPTTVSDVFQSTSFPSTESTTPFNMYAQTTPPGFGIYHPCVNHSVIISNSNRTINYTLQNGEHDDCESSYITAGWYRYEMLQNIPTKPPLSGQCGSSFPIWLNGTYPVIPNKNHSMLACKVGSSSNCEDSWNITVQNCLTFNVIYLEPFPSCGRYCMEPEWNYPSWIDACFYNNTIVTGDYTRTLDYVLSEGMSEDCESSNLTAGWYRYDGFQNIPTTPPSPGQCGSSSPIWLNGTYPDMPGMITPMTACAVSYSSSCQESWPVKALNCYSYNVVYLQPNGNCSKYCMNSQTYQMPTGSENCYTAAVIESTDDRTVEYDLMMNEIEKCDNITEGWYRFQENQNILNYPPSIGQCSSRAPVWLEGKYPTTYGETKTMKACMVSNNTNCENKGNVTVMNCYSYNVAYLTSLNGCGRICMEQHNSSGTTPPTMNHPCYSTSVIEGTYDRTFNYILQPGEVEDCDNITEGWYTFASGQSVPTTSPVPGQCGSRSPIWFSGTYPTSFEETTTMKACMVSNFSNCEDSWNVTVMHCYGYNVAYMKEINDCGRVCMEQMNSSGTTPPTMNHPCYSTSVIEGTYDRTFNYILQPGEVEDCDNITEGWYTFASGQSVPTTSPVPGQCGSRSPIWFSGTYPTSFEETTTMKACMVSNFSNCEDSWNVTVMHCYGYNVAYMKEVNDCGRVCMEQMNSSGTTPPTMNHPCYSTSVIEGTYDRTFNYILQPGEVEDCDNITEGWYTFASQQNVPTTPPVPGQCGSRSPVWFSGIYPTSFEETTTMKACMVSNFTNCEDSWNVTVMHCYGYNVAYMKELNDCGRVCMESNEAFNETINQQSSTVHPSQSFIYNASVSQANLEASYTASYSSFQPHATTVMSNTFSGEPIFTAPYSGYLPSETNHFYETASYEKTSSEHPSVDQLSSTESRNIQPTTVSDVTKSTSLPSTDSTTPFNMYVQTTPPWTGNYHPCVNHTLITSNFNRTINYTLQNGEHDDCESSYITAGWYRYEMLQNIPTKAPLPGQCGSSSPIWLNGTYSTNFDEYRSMSACQVGNSSICEKSWNVTVLSCMTFNVVYLEPVVSSCGRYCMEPEWTYPSWYGPCFYEHTIITGDYTRTIDYVLSEGMSEDCESSNLTAGWYRYDGFQNIPNTPPRPGQCGSSSPIWLNGSSPSIPGESTTMTACAVSESSTCQESWPVTMLNCYNYNVAYLEPNGNCSRYCMVSNNSYNQSINQSSSTIHFSQSQPYEPTASQENLIDSYTLPHSGYQPHATSAMSDTWSKDTMNSAPSSGYQPHATPVMSDKWSQDTMFTAPNSGYQPHATPVMSDTWSQDTMFSAPNSGYQPHATPVTSDKSSQDTMYSAPNSGYQPHATQAMSDTSTQDTMYSAPNSGYQPHATQAMSDTSTQDAMYSAPNSGYQPHATQAMSDTSTQDTMYSAPNSGYQPHATPVISDKWSQDTMYSATNSGYPQSNTNYLYEPASSEETYSEHHSFYQLSSTESWNIKPTSVQEETMSTRYLSTDSTTPLEDNYSFSETIYPSSSTTSPSDVFVHNSSMSPNSPVASYTEPNRLSSTDTLHQTASSETLYSEPESHYQSTTESWNIQPTSALKEMMSTTSLAVESTTQADEIVLSDFLSLSVDSSVPTFNPTSTDRQLMFKCKYYQYGSPILNDLLLDVKWEVNDVLFVEKYNLTLSQMQTEGRITKTDLKNAGITMGFNVKCGMRLSASSNSTYLESYPRYAGMEVWPKHMSLSSGESAKIYVWTTVPVACMYDSSSACDLTLEMNNFNEEFTSGAPMSCNQSITELTKPSVCGLVLDGWKTSSWQILDIKLPENTNQDQEYTAKLQLRVAFSIYDNFWVNYVLPEITISVINTNVTESYWNWYGFCFTGTDPWFLTTDWRWYDFHDEGEFSLFRHKTKPIEVNTIQRRFKSHHSWTEHCAIAVRAASDVFIIYGCGRPTKWIVRRLGCQTGSEYLEVYHRWGTYEIVLPTGTRVYVWIAMNRRLNVYITFSRKDRYQTEGLCGTWNNNWEDDFTGRDGKVYDRAYPFARTWSVPASDSLFIAKTRTEKLSQSFMYCTCLGDSGGTLNGLSANVDCSWKESLPVCPPLNFGKQSCSIRSKRSTDEDDDDLTIDISPDILTKKEHTERTSEWINGWNESSADDACNSYFKNSGSYDDCSSLSNVNVSSAITNCVLNIKVSGTDEYMADAFEMFKTECSNEIRTNNSLWNETNDAGNIVAQVVVGKLCPFDCKYKGIQLGDCVQGVCSCYQDLTGGDCRVNMSASPQILTNITDESFCDTSKRSCSHISVFGENFYESSNLGCLLQKAEIINNVLTANGTSSTTTGQMENIGEVKCLVSVNRRRKRSTTNETIQYYLVSVTNDGVTYSDSVPLILYDTSCYTCTTTDSNVNCQLRSDICVVDGICYSSSSSQCSSDESTGSKLWIIGIVISVLLVVIIVILLVKWCKSPRRVFPLCGEDNADKPSSSELYEAVSRGNTPEPLTRVNL